MSSLSFGCEVSACVVVKVALLEMLLSSFFVITGCVVVKVALLEMFLSPFSVVTGCGVVKVALLEMFLSSFSVATGCVVVKVALLEMFFSSDFGATGCGIFKLDSGEVFSVVVCIVADCVNVEGPSDNDSVGAGVLVILCIKADLFVNKKVKVQYVTVVEKFLTSR